MTYLMWLDFKFAKGGRLQIAIPLSLKPVRETQDLATHHVILYPQLLCMPRHAQRPNRICATRYIYAPCLATALQESLMEIEGTEIGMETEPEARDMDQISKARYE